MVLELLANTAHPSEVQIRIYEDPMCVVAIVAETARVVGVNVTVSLVDEKNIFICPTVDPSAKVTASSAS